MLFAESDTVQIVTAFFSLAGIAFTAYLAYKTAQLHQSQAITNQKVESVLIATNGLTKQLSDAKVSGALLQGAANERTRADASRPTVDSVAPAIESIAKEVVAQLAHESEKNKTDPVEEQINVTLPPVDPNQRR